MVQTAGLEIVGTAIPSKIENSDIPNLLEIDCDYSVVNQALLQNCILDNSTS